MLVLGLSDFSQKAYYFCYDSSQFTLLPKTKQQPATQAEMIRPLKLANFQNSDVIYSLDLAFRYCVY
jgi:hypothetical protein